MTPDNDGGFVVAGDVDYGPEGIPGPPGPQGDPAKVVSVPITVAPNTWTQVQVGFTAGVIQVFDDANAELVEVECRLVNDQFEIRAKKTLTLTIRVVGA